MKFVVDCMLGKLAKWLRILGFDAAYWSKAEDGELLDCARRENRILLTKDHRLLETAKDVPNLFIDSDDWRQQLDQVLHEFQLRTEIRPYSRCLACNCELKLLSKEKARNLVAPFVFERSDSFAICPRCGRVFWPGTHFEGMDSTVSRVLGRDKGSRTGATGRKRTPNKKTRSSYNKIKQDG
jgi:uncharacterized protein with PIN domain